MRTPHLAVACLALLALGAGCTGEKQPATHPAVAQVAGAIADVARGSLKDAWARTLPPSFERDADDLFSRLKALLSDEDLAAARDLAAFAAKKLAPVLSARKAELPALEAIAAKLEGLPSALGLDDPAAFRSKDVRGLLDALDRTILSELVKAEDFRRRIAAIQVDLAERKGSWARLRMRSPDAEGREAVEDLDVILVEGRWIPNAWAVDWPGVIESGRKELTSLERAKAERPATVREAIESARALFEAPDAIAQGIVERLKGSAGGPVGKVGG